MLGYSGKIFKKKKGNSVIELFGMKINLCDWVLISIGDDVWFLQYSDGTTLQQAKYQISPIEYSKSFQKSQIVHFFVS